MIAERLGEISHPVARAFWRFDDQLAAVLGDH
jgi:hypothetical protein